MENAEPPFRKCEAEVESGLPRIPKGDLDMSSLCNSTDFGRSLLNSFHKNANKKQKFLHEELDRVIGSDRQVTISDKNDLPFVTAFINTATREVDVDGRVVLAGVGILHQIASVLYNEKVFPDTQKFVPQRFLDQNGQLKKKDFAQLMIVVILIAASIIFLIHQFIWRRRNLPPGPTPLPLVGNMLSFIRHPPGYEPFIRWEKRFGPVFTIWMGNSPVVVISDIEVLKATFVRNGDAFNDKFILDEFNQRFRGGDYGLIDVNGDRWRDHRRFALHQLRDFGLGRDLMQFQVLLEAENVAKVFSSAGSTEVCVQSAFNLATGSIINQFLFGYRFSEGREAEFRELKETLDSFLKDMGEPLVIILLFHPFLGNIFSGFFKRMAVYREKLMGFYERQIQEHRKEIDFDQAENKDYVEAFLKEQNRRQAEGDFESFSIDQLKSMCFDLWTAGSDTTTNTMAFIVAYAINYPQQQKLLHEELDRVIGSDRQVTISDKNDLPFVTAFINESQRMANIVPINLVRVATREVDVDGRVVPAGVGILHQIASVLYNEKVFPDTQKFDPRRFLDQNGQLKKVEELIPFSIGKRQCLGEGLARMELFLFTANLFNRFEFLPGAKGAPSLEKDHNAIVRPRSYTCIIKKRISS